MDKAASSENMYKAAVYAVIDAGEASTSILQRNLRIGYTQAAKLLDKMTSDGIIGSFEGYDPRKVLITREQFDNNEYNNLQIKTKIVGVTFNNADGTNRQKILANLASGGACVELELSRYSYNGAPAYHVLCDGQVIGNIPADLAARIAGMDDKGIVICPGDITIYGGPDEDDLDKSYGATLTLRALP